MRPAEVDQVIRDVFQRWRRESPDESLTGADLVELVVDELPDVDRWEITTRVERFLDLLADFGVVRERSR